MNYCTNCGAELGLGRFCTNCGAPISRPADSPAMPEAAPPRPSGAPPAGPPPGRPPSPQPTMPGPGTRPPVVAPDAGYGSRFPLYADDLAATRSPAIPAPLVGVPLAASAPLTAPAPTSPVPTSPGGRRGTRRSNTPWVVLLLIGILTAGVTGFWLATRDPDSSSAAGDERRTPGASASTTPEGSEDPSDEETPADGEPSDLVSRTRVEAPAPLPPGQDVEGNPVTYTATNMLDSNARTAYRVRGDASGAVITFELPDESTITEVGLINGYAKTDSDGTRTVSWYAKNRRILQVEWRFDDGSTVTQDLAQEQSLQTIEVSGKVSRTVELRIIEVSPPGRGALSKNVTAISDVLILGS